MHPNLVSGQYYHIYNRVINSCILFKDETNYKYFLSLYNKYINPVAYTYAWVLMPNHFHFLIQIKEDIIYKFNNSDRSADTVGLRNNKWETITKPDSVENL